MLGAKVTGYALNPPTDPSMYELCNIDELVTSVIADIRDGETLKKAMLSAEPAIVMHMAAQPIVRDSYKNPVETYAINVMGTVNLFEAVRQCKSVKAVINVTTDKCYENKEWIWGYRENEPLGGYDPYSSSKACSELVTAAYRSSFFSSSLFSDDINDKSSNRQNYKSSVSIASVRAGNVIGGGDWAKDRLISDILNAFMEERPALIRNPKAIRPWQHVLEPLNGYLTLAEQLLKNGADFAKAWNFGPNAQDDKPVAWIADRLVKLWGKSACWTPDMSQHPHESNFLKLDCSRAKLWLGWSPKLPLEEALEWTIAWYNSYKNGENMRRFTETQINLFQGLGL